MRLICIIFFREDSVWAAWFKEVVLKGSPLIKMRVENGRSARFWLDNWAPTSSITMSHVFPGGCLGIPLNATIASLRREENWRLPPARTEAMLELCEVQFQNHLGLKQFGSRVLSRDTLSTCGW